MAGLRVHFVMSQELVERIDGALVEGQSRGEFVRRAVEEKLGAREDRERWAWTADGRRPDPREDAEQALSEAKEPLGPVQADPGSVPSSEGVRSAAPAEQPDTRAMDLLREDDPDPDFVARGRVPEFPSSNGRMARSSLVAKRDVRPVLKGK